MSDQYQISIWVDSPDGNPNNAEPVNDLDTVRAVMLELGAPDHTPFPEDEGIWVVQLPPDMVAELDSNGYTERTTKIGIRVSAETP